MKFGHAPAQHQIVTLALQRNEGLRGRPRHQADIGLSIRPRFGRYFQVEIIVLLPVSAHQVNCLPAACQGFARARHSKLRSCASLSNSSATVCSNPFNSSAYNA